MQEGSLGVLHLSEDVPWAAAECWLGHKQLTGWEPLDKMLMWVPLGIKLHECMNLNNLESKKPEGQGKEQLKVASFHILLINWLIN